MEKVTTKSKYDKKFNKQYYRFHMFRKSTSIYFVFALGLAVVFIAAQNTFSSKADTSQTLMMWLLAAFTLMLTPMMMWRRITGIIRKEINLRGEADEVVEITKDKITRKVDGVSDKLVFGWNQIHIIHETKDLFLFYVNNDAAIVVIKKDIITGDIDTLRKMIEKCMGRTKKGKLLYKKHVKEAK